MKLIKERIRIKNIKGMKKVPMIIAIREMTLRGIIMIEKGVMTQEKGPLAKSTQKTIKKMKEDNPTTIKKKENDLMIHIPQIPPITQVQFEIGVLEKKIIGDKTNTLLNNQKVIENSIELRTTIKEGKKNRHNRIGNTLIDMIGEKIEDMKGKDMKNMKEPNRPIKNIINTKEKETEIKAITKIEIMSRHIGIEKKRKIKVVTNIEMNKDIEIHKEIRKGHIIQMKGGRENMRSLKNMKGLKNTTSMKGTIEGRRVLKDMNININLIKRKSILVGMMKTDTKEDRGINMMGIVDQINMIDNEKQMTNITTIDQMIAIRGKTMGIGIDKEVERNQENETEAKTMKDKIQEILASIKRKTLITDDYHYLMLNYP